MSTVKQDRYELKFLHFVDNSRFEKCEGNKNLSENKLITITLIIFPWITVLLKI